MLFLLLMILTGMLIKAAIILGAGIANRIEQQIAHEQVEEAAYFKIKAIPTTEIIKTFSL